MSLAFRFMMMLSLTCISAILFFHAIPSFSGGWECSLIVKLQGVFQYALAFPQRWGLAGHFPFRKEPKWVKCIRRTKRRLYLKPWHQLNDICHMDNVISSRLLWPCVRGGLPALCSLKKSRENPDAPERPCTKYDTAKVDFPAGPENGSQWAVAGFV